jgi:hypothetical protein
MGILPRGRGSKFLQQFAEFQGTYHRFGYRRFRQILGILHKLFAVPAVFSQDFDFSLEHGELGGGNITGTIQKIGQNPGKLPFQIGQIVKFHIPFQKAFVFDQVSQEIFQGVVDKVNIFQGLSQEQFRVRIEGEGIPDHPNPHIQDENIILKIDMFIHGLSDYRQQFQIQISPNGKTPFRTQGIQRQSNWEFLDYRYEV